MTDQPTPPVTNAPPEDIAEPARPNVFFRMAVAATAIFILTILATVATIFGDADAPPTRFLHRHGDLLMLMEVVIAVTLGAMAIAADRKEIRRRNADQQPAAATRPEDRHE
ncbi:MAG: hypothetical protein O3A00_03550 [Planctomycetota bacterium]|nr:hypothetical protein [Planctomycetota bacterium]